MYSNLLVQVKSQDIMINPHVKFQVHMTKSQFKSLVLKFRPQVKSQVLTFNNPVNNNKSNAAIMNLLFKICKYKLINKLVWTRPIKFQL